MAKKPNSDPAFDQDAIQKLFLKAKSSGSAFPFAFGLASKPDECGFLVDLRRPAKTLKKELKASSKAIGKVCFGTFTISQGDVLLKPEKPLKGIVRQLKIRFRNAGMKKFKPVLVGDDGKAVDEDSLPDADQYEDIDDNSDAIGETAAKAGLPPPDAGDLKKRLARIKAQLGDQPDTVAKRLNAPFVKAVNFLGKGETESALSEVELLEAALTKLKANAPKDTPKQKPEDAFKSLMARMGKLPKDQMQALLPQLQAIKKGIGKGSAEAALKGIGALNAQIDEASSAEKETSNKDSLLKIWSSAKENADKDITKLADALKGFDDPALARIAEHGITGLNNSDVYTRLTGSLFDHEKAAVDEKEESVEAVQSAVTAFREALMNDPMVQHWENNPMSIPVDIRGILGAALDQIQENLKSAA